MNRTGALSAAMIFVLLALTACGYDLRPIPNYRRLEQNAPSNSDYQPHNSLPP